MSKPKRGVALLAYLLPIFGWLYVLLFQRKDEFAVYHARQSIALTIVAVVTPVVWALIAWVLAQVPFVGPITAAALFSLVIATYIFLAAAWIIGMVYALQAKMKPVPVLGGWAERLPVE